MAATVEAACSSVDPYVGVRWWRESGRSVSGKRELGSTFCFKFKSTGIGGDLYRMFIFLDNSNAKDESSAFELSKAPGFCHDSKYRKS